MVTLNPEPYAHHGDYEGHMHALHHGGHGGVSGAAASR